MNVKILYTVKIVLVFSQLLISQNLTVFYERIDPNPFELIQKPVGITVFPFIEKEDFQDFSQKFYSALISQPGIHNKFIIYSPEVVTAQLGLNGIYELNTSSLFLLSRLKSMLGIEFVIKGTVKKMPSLHFTIYLISTETAEIVSYFDVQESSNSTMIIDAVKIFSESLRPVYKNIEIPDGMVFVNGGWFEMGSDIGRSNEKPVHRVHVSDFFIDKYEVTVGAYSEFCDSVGKQMPVQPEYFTDKHPVVNVNWEDGLEYAIWKGKRLPTEAEWEYAAMGINENTYQYSGNSILDKVGWYTENSNSVIHQVGALQPNEFGIYDLSGNVWEWCSDWYSLNFYSKGESLQPKGPTSGTEKVLRGGSFDDDMYFCRVKYRNKNYPDRTFSNYGFRCVMDVVE